MVIFDKTNKLTISDIHRGLQQKLYDECRLTLLPANGINILQIYYHQFQHNQKKGSFATR